MRNAPTSRKITTTGTEHFSSVSHGAAALANVELEQVAARPARARAATAVPTDLIILPPSLIDLETDQPERLWLS
jgi:hypothetical protein